MLGHQFDEVAGGAWFIACHASDCLTKKRALGDLILHARDLQNAKEYDASSAANDAEWPQPPE